LTAYEVKLKQRAKIIAGLMGILLVLILIKIVFVFLYIKHIPIPRIVDILA
jgi:type IV secretory pathway VirB3-like protein